VINSGYRSSFKKFDCEDYSFVKTVFSKFIEPIYADQTDAIKKIVAGADRKCEIMLMNGLSIGLIVYKIALQSEYGLNDAFELKTLLLADDRGYKGLGRLLFNYSERLAKEYKAKYIYATVSEKLSKQFPTKISQNWRGYGKNTNNKKHT
jgi:hypothetical protein